jgi:hypothetical protein
MQEELNRYGFVIHGDRVNVLELIQTDFTGYPTNETSLT